MTAIALPEGRRAERREWLVFLRRLAARRTALFGLVVVAIVVLTAVAAPLLSPFDPIEQDLGDRRLKEPGFRDAAGALHPLGTDHLGRDLMARVIYGARPALLVGFAAVAISGLIGMAAGLVSGYFGGRMDDLLMRLADIQLAFPFILLAIAVIGVLGPSLKTIIVVIGVSSWVVYARIVRGAVLTLREREFVDAAKVAGATSFRIMRKHMIPNAMGVIIVNTTLLASQAVLLETALSYLGFGIKSPDVSLGTMISEYQSAFSTRPWLFWWPGLFIIMIALSVNFIGDGLRDAFDPRQKRVPSERKMNRAAARQARDEAEEATS